MDKKFDLIALGGGLSNLLFLKELGEDLPDSVAIIEPAIPKQSEYVHWSYWSRHRTYFDRFAIGSWDKVETNGSGPHDIAPFKLRLVRSSDVNIALHRELAQPGVKWIHEKADRIIRRDHEYLIHTDNATYKTETLMDSAVSLEPAFPVKSRPHLMISGTGLVIGAKNPIFNPDVASVFEPMDGGGFAYVLPLTEQVAVVESAVFSDSPKINQSDSLIKHIKTRYPRSGLKIIREENGIIPLGFSNRRTLGPRHVLMGTKRGLVKPSAGYGITRIEREAKLLANLWKNGHTLPTTRTYKYPWHLMDSTFLRLVGRQPGLANEFLSLAMKELAPNKWFQLLDETLPFGETARFMTKSLPFVSLKSLTSLYNRGNA